MREPRATRIVLAGVITAAVLSGASVAWASHDAACRLLPTSGTRAGTRSCNPRHECINDIPNSVGGPARDAAVAACNAFPTSGTCPTVRSFNPRQECLDMLPPTPAVSIARVDGGAAGGNKIYAARPDVLRVHGPNVGMTGNTAAGEAGLVVGLVLASNCAPPNCVGLAVESAPNAEGPKGFQIRAWHGHSQAGGSVQVLAMPNLEPPVHLAVPNFGGATFSTGRLAAPFSVPLAFLSPIGVDHDRNEGRNPADCRNYQGRPFPACYDQHEGTDFMMVGGFATMDAGSFDVIAAAGGVVTEVASGHFDRCFFDPREPDRINCQGDQREVANFVNIRQDDGLLARYLHLKKDSVTVRKDQRVACGHILGKVGSSGRSSAPHLHFELRRDKAIVDPYAEKLWISVDVRNVPNAKCPVGVLVGPPAKR
jgi:murein DD-endopeptidase MepM/ murein hydrolase activator NlpD